MLKIVIDTNALIDAETDAYHFASRIIDLVVNGQIKAYANISTIRENKLLVGKKIEDDAYLKKIESYFDLVEQVNSEKIDVIEDDPEDNKILASAIAGNADYLITSDKHLLKLETYGHLKIIRPNQFWSIWEDEGEGWAKWLTNFIQ